MRVLVFAALSLLALPSSTATAQSAPGVAVTYIASPPSGLEFRFVAEITNPFGETLEGVQTQWEALDASGVIVGASTRKQPPIMPGATYIYVDGTAGSLSGSPQSVRMSIVKPGILSSAQSRLLQVESITVKLLDNRFFKGPHYTVSAVLSTGAETVDRFDLFTSYVLRDQTGAIVGADSGSWDSNLPQQLTPGNRYRIENIMPATGTAVTADVLAHGRL